MHTWLTPFFVILFISTIFAQPGSVNTFDFLQLTQSARTSALGGYPIAIADDDVNIALMNPAALSEKSNHQLAINHNFHFADITYGSGAYGYHSDALKTSFIGGFQYISYGQFVGATASGERGETFKASENAFVIGASRLLNERIRVGLQVKAISSRFENYDAFGLGMDLGLVYHQPEGQDHVSFVIKNIGIQVNAFDLEKEDLPLDIQIGFSRRLKYVPFRFFITAHHLNRWNLRSDFALDDDPFFLDAPPSEPGAFSIAVDNFFRHFTIGGELYIGNSETVRLRAGYDHQRKKDLSVPGFRSFSGLSFGFGIHIKKIKFDYAFGRYHLAGGVNHLSISLNLDTLFSKP